MAFTDYEFPHADLYKTSLRELIHLVEELQVKVENISAEILEAAKEYTDEQLAGYQEQVNALKAEVEGDIAELDGRFRDLVASVNASLNMFDTRLDDMHDEMVADIAAVNARTDLAIEQNNEYLLSEMVRYLADILVLNALTGEEVTIQEMFNYLCTLHMDNAITYDELAAKNITYDDFAALHMTYTQLAMNGKSIIP